MKSLIKTFMLLALIIAVVAVYVDIARPLGVKKPAEAVYAVSKGDEMVATNIMALANKERTTASLNALATSEKLNTAACYKLEHMVQEDYWSHNSPTGITPWLWFDKADYQYSEAGENLAYGQVSASKLIQDWMNSPKHKENIISDKYTEQGMCTKYVYNYQGQDCTLTVHLFGTPLYN